MVKTSNSLAVLAALFAQAAFADQPVHCIKNQVLGEWQFQISESVNVDIFEAKTVCSHQLPNKVQIIQQGTDFSLSSGSVHSVNVLLEDDFSATVLNENGSKTNKKGHWSMIYDQGFFITIGDHRYYANFKYEIKPGHENKATTASGGDYEYFDSICGSTMPGFVQKHSSDGTVIPSSTQCFLGELVKPADGSYEIQEKTNGTAKLVTVKTDEATLALTGSQVQAMTGSLSRNTVRSHGRDQSQSMIKDNQRLIQFINSQKASFEVQDYSVFDNLESGLMLAQSNKGKSFDDSQEFQEALAEAQRYIGKDISIDELPEEWNWEDVQGYNFTSDVLDQKACGSCYTFATIATLISRIKIWYGQVRDLSTQFPLQCNYMTEGCEGGWGLMQGFFLEQFYTTSESCAAYQANTKITPCSAYQDCEPVAKVANVRYLGKHYGGMSEVDLMKELRANGPFLMDLQVPGTFTFYKNGILSDQSFEELQANYESMLLAQTSLDNEGATAVNEVTQEDAGIAWTPLNHSTVVIGYGYDETFKEKYWLVRNSYGGAWGDSGNFKIRRGHNDFGAEGESSTFDPVLLQ